MATSGTFPLLELPSTPLLHLLQLLPHASLATLAASCSFLHATLHSSPSLWRRLTLRPTSVASAAATQALLAVLRRHGAAVTVVRLTDGRGQYWQNDAVTQVLGLLAASCPLLPRLSLRAILLGRATNPLSVLATCLPHLATLTIKHLHVLGGRAGLQELAGLTGLTHLVLRPNCSRKTMEMLALVFSQLRGLRVVSVGFASCLRSPHTRRHLAPATFLPTLLAHNPGLQEVELVQDHFCSVIASPLHRALLGRRGVRLAQPGRDPVYDSSDEESE